MSAVTITGEDGKPILYASMHGEHLRFEFEYYARDDSETDYEFIHTVFPVDFPSIPKLFGLDPASREEILGALGEYQGAVIMVSHDEGAVQALKPERVILLPDGDEDIWKDEYFDLVAID